MKWQFKMDCPIVDIKVNLMAIAGYLVTLEEKKRSRRGGEISRPIGKDLSLRSTWSWSRRGFQHGSCSSKP